MFIPVERLLLRHRQVPARAEELIALRQRVRTEHAAQPSEEERAIAREIRTLKLQVSAAMTAVASCTSCATGRRPPRGRFAGGDCCSGVTADLFSDDEVAALVSAGTRPRHLRAPRTEQAGCAFRGATGCTLSPSHRPQRCVHYTCSVLRRELRARGDLAAIDPLLDELQRLMRRFVELRHARLDEEVVASLEDALRRARAAAGRP